jgi:hypothetical protein
MLGVVAFGQNQAPQIQNGRMETRRGTAIDRELAAVSGAGSTDPVWIAWRAPMVPGDRDMCSWYSDRLGTVRASLLDDGTVFVSGTSLVHDVRPQITPPTGPIPLEAGTGIVVLARVIAGQVERLRTIGDDCPVDAGGRTVHWLPAVTSADSLRFLSTLARSSSPDRSQADLQRRVSESAIRAIGYHADPAATALLDQIATNEMDASLRRQAASTLGSLREGAGVTVLTRLIGAERDAAVRRSLVGALGQSRAASAGVALRSILNDAEARIRAEAGHWFVIRGGAAVIPDALKIITTDADETVKRRLVSAIGLLPANAGTTALLQLARTSTNQAVRREAVKALAQSKDPRAIALLEEILKR